MLQDWMRKFILYRKIRFYQLLTHIGKLLASARQEDYVDIINASLRLLGEYVHADRTYIFKYDLFAGTCSNTFEVCQQGISSEISNLQNISLDGIPDWFLTHQRGESLYIPDVEKLLKANRVRELLESQRVRSLLTIPMFIDNTLFGFLGFDSVTRTRKYSGFEQTLLKEYSILLVSLFKRIDMENAVEKQSRKIRHIIDAANLGTWEWDLSTDRVDYDPKWAGFVGYSLEELEPHTLQTWISLTDPDDLECARQNIRRTIEGVTDKYECTYRMRHKDGHVVWIKDFGKVIEYKDENPAIMLGAHMDITDLKKQQQDAQVRVKALDFSPVAILITNRNGLIEYANPAFTDMIGLSRDELTGSDAFQCLEYLQADGKQNAIYNELQEKHHWVGELPTHLKDGSSRWFSVQISQVTDEVGIVTNYVVIQNDITQRKHSEILLGKERERLKEDLRRKIVEVDDVQNSAILALAKLTEERDYDTGRHVERVQFLCKALALSLQANDKFQDSVNNEFIEDLFFASALHDIGKVKVSDSILLKPGKLTSEEYAIIKMHTVFGFRILSEIARNSPSSKFIIAARIAKHHHEWWNGTGYPDRLSAESIPLEARIMSVVDVYDALRSSRPYKKSISHNDTIKMIASQKGSQFDPDVVNALLSIQSQFEITYDSFTDRITDGIEGIQ